jgi:hypothetical protein
LKKSAHPTRMGGFFVFTLPYTSSYDQHKYRNQERLMALITGCGRNNMNKEQVLRDYRNGDAEKRLNFFLYYRDLRNEFSGIDGERELERSQSLWTLMFRHGTTVRSHFHLPWASSR